MKEHLKLIMEEVQAPKREKKEAEEMHGRELKLFIRKYKTVTRPIRAKKPGLMN